MSSKWHEKKLKQAEYQFEKNLVNAPDDTTKTNIISEVAMGGGDVQVFEKKLSKEEKKNLAKLKREEKTKLKQLKQSSTLNENDNEEDTEENRNKQQQEEEENALLQAAQNLTLNPTGTTSTSSGNDDGIDHIAADILASKGTICTFALNRKGVDHRSRDINVTNFTLQHMGNILFDETDVVLNHGNRYGIIGKNGCGKSTLLRAIGSRAIPIPRLIDIFFLSEEVQPSDTITAIEAVMSVDEERVQLEQQADDMNQYLSILSDKIANNETPTTTTTTNTTTNGGDDDNGGGGGITPKSYEEQQEDLMEMLHHVYERLDALDASTAEVRARSILAGLGFTHDMQSKVTKDFSGGWRMRVSLARALFIQPLCLLLDEPTNHLDMEAVIWLEDYLSKWNKILVLISHSQDFLNNVCTHMIHVTKSKKLEYFDGNYDQYMKTKSEKDENQMKQYKWEQEQIKSMKEYIARFGHGTAKNAKQAQSKEKVLAKMIRGGLTEKPDEDKVLNFKFPNPGHLPPPVLAFHDVSFAYPKCESLYTNVNFGIDLDSRIALVGPNGAGKTTLIKLMAGELQPSMGDIRPHGHLKLGRFTQHFVDVLNLELTPLEFFEQTYPTDAREDQRKYLGRFGISGKMQIQKMNELSDGQKSRVVFAKLGRDVPHILLLDEPTNHLDMESIDALAKAINEFEGGLVLVSHDMRLIGQVANEIWICDQKTITPYKGDIQNFKMDMRAQMGIGTANESSSTNVKKLKGDASVTLKPNTGSTSEKTIPVKKPVKLEVIAPVSKKPVMLNDDDNKTVSTQSTISSKSVMTTTPPPVPSNNPPFTAAATSVGLAPNRYIPPHLRKKMMEEEQQKKNAN